MIRDMEDRHTKFGGTLPETTELERGINAEHVRLANEINAETIGLQQQEITRLRSLAHLRDFQVSAEQELALAAASWLWTDRDQLVFGNRRLGSLLETGEDFATFVTLTINSVADNAVVPRFECEGCRDPKCGFGGYLCAEDAQPPAIVRARKMSLRFARAAVKVAEIRERIAGMVD